MLPTLIPLRSVNSQLVNLHATWDVDQVYVQFTIMICLHILGVPNKYSSAKLDLFLTSSKIRQDKKMIFSYIILRELNIAEKLPSHA